MDGYDQVYPQYLHIATKISEKEFLPQMDYCIGLGNGGWILPDMDNWVSFFGTEKVAYLMGISVILKIFLSALFFYQYCCTMGISPLYAMFGGLAYAFCGNMMVRQFWQGYQNQQLLWALWLYCIELALCKNKKQYVPIASFFMFYYYKAGYYAIFYLFVMIAYILFRMLWMRKEYFDFSNKKIFLLLCMVVFIALFMGGGIFSYINYINGALSSARYIELIKGSDAAATGFGDIFIKREELVQLFLRTIGLNINGIKDNYVGPSNYLGAPAFYCGNLFLLLFLPVSCNIVKNDKRKTIPIILACAGLALYIFCNKIRLLVNANVETAFRMSSVWVTILVLYIVLHGIHDYFKQLTRKKILFLWIETALLFKAGLYICNEQNGINKKYLYIALFITLLITLILTIAYYCRFRSQFIGIIFCVLVGDLVFNAYNCVHDIDTMTFDRLSNYGYADMNTLDALAFLTNTDSTLYRTEKQYFSYRFNDSWAQNYNGTSFYVGGTGINQYTISFYESLKMPTSSPSYNYAYGIQTNNTLGTLLGVKYILSKNVNSIANYGYEQIYQNDTVSVWKNQYYLPFLYTYDSFLTREEFEKYDPQQKSYILLNACVIDAATCKNAMYGIRHENAEDLESIYGSINLYEYEVPLSKKEDGSYILNYQGNGNVVLLSFKTQLAEPDYRAVLSYMDSNNQQTKYYVRIDGDEQVNSFDINSDDIQSFLLGVDVAEAQAFVIPQEIYYQNYRKAVSALKSTPIDISVINKKEVLGTISMKDAGILYFSSVYDKNWELYIDDQRTNTFVANIGFTGAFIEAGEHEIHFIYRNQNYRETVMRILTMLFLCISCIVLGNVKRKRRHENGI